jgi:hypothetical protein
LLENYKININLLKYKNNLNLKLHNVKNKIYELKNNLKDSKKEILNIKKNNFEFINESIQLLKNFNSIHLNKKLHERNYCDENINKKRKIICNCNGFELDNPFIHDNFVIIDNAICSKKIVDKKIFSNNFQELPKKKICYNCQNLFKKIKKLKKKIEDFEKNPDKLLNSKIKLFDPLISKLKIEILKKNLSKKEISNTDINKINKNINNLINKNCENEIKLIELMTSIINEKKLNKNDFFFHYLSDIFKNINQGRNNNNKWSDDVIQFFQILKFYSSKKTINLLNGNGEKIEIKTENGKKYSSGYNKNFNILGPSLTTLKHHQTKNKYGFFLSDNQIKKMIENIKTKDKVLNHQPFLIAWDETDIRGGLEFDIKTGLVLPDPISIDKFNNDNNYIFNNKSDSIIQFFIIFPLLSVAFPIGFFNFPPSSNQNKQNEIQNENNEINSKNFIFNKII